MSAGCRRNSGNLTLAGGLRTSFADHGVCLYKSKRTGRTFAFLISHDAHAIVEQWELSLSPRGLSARPVGRRWTLEGKTERCAADNDRGFLYVDEEDGAVLRYGAEPGEFPHPRDVDQPQPGRLVADI